MTEASPQDPPPAEHPHIRSFSGRRGHFTSGQRQAYEQLLPRWSIDYRPQPLDLAAAFGRQAPVVLEIGFGMGETTARIAAARPECNFLGVEVYPAGVGSLLMKIDAAGLQNLRLIQHDAIEVVRAGVAAMDTDLRSMISRTEPVVHRPFVPSGRGPVLHGGKNPPARPDP